MIKNSMNVHPTAFSSKKTLTFNEQITDARIKKELNRFLSFLTRDLKQNGCKLIGHVKGLADGRDKGHLMFSITDFHGKATFKGELYHGVTRVELAINIIVYGIELLPVKLLFEKAYDKFFGIIKGEKDA